MKVLQFTLAELDYKKDKERILEIIRECECCKDKTPIIECELMLDSMYDRLRTCQDALLAASNNKYCIERSQDCESECTDRCVKNRIQMFMYRAALARNKI